MYSGFSNSTRFRRRAQFYTCAGPGKSSGFTLIELVVVIVLVGLIAASLVVRFVDFTEASKQANVRDQARQLISNNNLNIARCKTGSPGCINLTTTGAQACANNLSIFMPELDLDRFEVRNISSATPQNQWRDLVGPDEALFWIDRFLGQDTNPLQPQFNPTQPCILSLVKN